MEDVARKPPDEKNFDRQGALTKAEPRPEKVVLGTLVADRIRATGRPHRLISDRGLERFIHDVGAVETLPEYEVDRASHLHASFGRRMAPTAKQIEYFQYLADGMSVHDISELKGCSHAAVDRILERCIWNLGATRGRGQGPAEAMGILVAAGIVRGKPLPAFPESKRGKGLRGGDGKFKPILKGAPAARPTKQEEITGRKRQVLALVVQGATDAAIGASLGIASETIKTYMKQLLRQYGARNRTNLAWLAARSGFEA